MSGDNYEDGGSEYGKTTTNHDGDETMFADDSERAGSDDESSQLPVSTMGGISGDLARHLANNDVETVGDMAIAGTDGLQKLANIPDEVAEVIIEEAKDLCGRAPGATAEGGTESTTGVDEVLDGLDEDEALEKNYPKVIALVAGEGFGNWNDDDPNVRDPKSEWERVMQIERAVQESPWEPEQVVFADEALGGLAFDKWCTKREVMAGKHMRPIRVQAPWDDWEGKPDDEVKVVLDEDGKVERRYWRMAWKARNEQLVARSDAVIVVNDGDFVGPVVSEAKAWNVPIHEPGVEPPKVNMPEDREERKRMEDRIMENMMAPVDTDDGRRDPTTDTAATQDEWGKDGHGAGSKRDFSSN